MGDAERMIFITPKQLADIAIMQASGDLSATNAKKTIRIVWELNSSRGLAWIPHLCGPDELLKVFE